MRGYYHLQYCRLDIIGGVSTIFNKYAKNDEGVSAIIGIILMVAVTAILAAVIAAFVFGSVAESKKFYTVAVTAQRISPTQNLVTNYGSNDLSHVTGINVVATTGTPSASGVLGLTPGGTNVISGATAPDTVIVTATWDDGSSSIILTQTL
jgi:FlaG/FlaF family flagellin (archaellin)